MSIVFGRSTMITFGPRFDLLETVNDVVNVLIESQLLCNRCPTVLHRLCEVLALDLQQHPHSNHLNGGIRRNVRKTSVENKQ